MFAISIEDSAIEDSAMEQRLHKQIRAIRNYAKAMHLDLDTAAKQWCEVGLAERWADGY
jgi:hypothetical protein